MPELLWITLAGAVGTLCRYGLGSLVHRFTGTSFPYGTLAVNVLGCFVIGLVMQIGLNTTLISRTVRVAITIGFLGAFTTFSSFGYETLRLAEEGMWQAALLNVGLNLALGFGAVAAGFGAGKLLYGGA